MESRRLFQLSAVFCGLILLNQQHSIVCSRHKRSDSVPELKDELDYLESGLEDSGIPHDEIADGDRPLNEARMLRLQEGEGRKLWNSQSTTTLMRFGGREGPADDEILPRIDRNSSIEWLARESGFNPNLTTVFVIHGFMGMSLSNQRWANEIRNLINRHKNAANVFYVDWSHKAMTLFPIYGGAVEGSVVAGEDLWQIITNLAKAFPYWDWTNIHLIGHSLGSHVSGRAGYLLGSKIKQITAMDPPDTLQIDWPHEKKLTADDAQYVLTMMTDAGGLGSIFGKADVTVLVNGGYVQPGCNSVTGYLCRHMKGAYYNSVNMGKCIMVAYRADSYEQFSRGEVAYCEQNSDVCVGVGNWWQYDDGLQMSDIHFRPGDDWRRHRPSNPQWRPLGREYFLKASEDPPYCVFTYQVVVRMSSEQAANINDGQLYVSLSTSMERRAKNSAAEDVRVALSRTRSTKSLHFGPKRQKTRRTGSRQSSAEIVFTGLALVDATHPKYKSMPAKFVKAIVWLPAQTGPAGGGGQLVGNGSYPQVQVNFMSENRFERRQQYSGQPDRVYWFPPS